MGLYFLPNIGWWFSGSFNGQNKATNYNPETGAGGDQMVNVQPFIFPRTQWQHENLDLVTAEEAEEIAKRNGGGGKISPSPAERNYQGPNPHTNKTS